MYPLKFESSLIKKVWGGRSFEEVLNIKLPDNEKYGEQWSVSAHKNGMSYVSEGKLKGLSLQELLEISKEKLVGKKVYDKFGDKFPLLIKFLDINDKLSVQVHPDDEYALAKEGEFGKSECWFVIDASEDAKLILGVKAGVSKEKFAEKVKNNDFDDLFNTVSVKKGDLINVKPGLVHASLEGSVLICEPQQNSDTTYRIYDFDRIVDGQKRELHLDKAMEVIDFDAEAEIINENDIESDNELKELLKEKYFNVDILNIDKKYNDKKIESFKVFSILDGVGILRYKEKEYTIKQGDTYFIPSNLEIELDGMMKILKIYL